MLRLLSVFFALAMSWSSSPSLMAQSVQIQWTDAGGTLPPTPLGIYSMAQGVLGNTLHLSNGVQGLSEGRRNYSWSPGQMTWTTLTNAPSGIGACDVNNYWVGCGGGVGNGQFFAVGGWDNVAFPNVGRTVLTYTPGADCWACNGYTCIPVAAGGYASASLNDRLHFLGGVSGAGAYEHHHSDFHTVTRTRLDTLALPPGPQRAFGSALALDNQVWYLGGQFAYMGGSIFLNPFDPPVAAGGGGGGGGGITRTDPDPFLCDMLAGDCPALGGCCDPGSLCAFFSCCLGAACGGGGGGPCVADNACSARVDSFNPATNMWTSRAPMPLALAGHVVVEHDNLLYVIGGVDSCLNFNLSVLVYSPVCDQWVTVPTLDAGGLVHLAAAVLDDAGTSQIFRAGGLDALTGESTNRLQVMGYTLATAPNVPVCDITAPAPAATVCNTVNIDYTVTDADSPMPMATWRWSTDGGVSWSTCTDNLGGANPRNVPTGMGTFQWDADTDIGVGPQAVTLAMCISDGNMFGEDRVDVIVDCAGVACCNLAGDCDGSRELNILDAFTALRFSAGLAPLGVVAFANCNVAFASYPEVTVMDGLRIAQYTVGLVPSLDCCP